MKILLVLNDPPYGSERCYNALRLARSIQKADSTAQVTVFLMADSVGCARRGQQVPAGYYNLEQMLAVIARSGSVLLCGLYMDARGLADDCIIDGAQRSSMDELAALTIANDRVVTF